MPGIERVCYTLSIVSLGAITAELFYVKHPLSRTRERAAHTYGTEALSVSTEEVGRAHAQRRRGAVRRAAGASFPVSKFPALAIQEVGYSTINRIPDPIKLG